MNDSGKDSEQALAATIDRYNEAWNAHDLDAIVAMHAPDMVFDNHTAGESATARRSRAHIGAIFETGPTRFHPPSTSDGLVQEWTSSPTTDDAAAISARRSRSLADRRDPLRGRPVKRKDVYSDSVSILRQVGLLAKDSSRVRRRS